MDIKELVEMQRNYYMTLQTKDIDQRIKTIENIKIWILAVSYTHLTLPTTSRV